MVELLPNMDLIEKSQDLFELLDILNNVIKQNTQLLEAVSSELIDIDFLDEIKSIVDCGTVSIYFGKTLRELKIVIQDDGGIREHEIYLQYKAPRKLIISSNIDLPHSSILNREYRCLEELIETLRKYINDLGHYFCQLESMDLLCTIMEPVKATYKHDYRRILLDDRTWLHVEVTPEGSATNIHLVGQSVHWHNKLQSGLLTWDHDKNIVENILTIFDLDVLPQLTSLTRDLDCGVQEDKRIEDNNTAVCGICLCAELSGESGMPQPLCQNVTCGVYYHRNCLYQWLVACAGSRPPAFGVANGACPTCLQPITCSENDN